MTAKIFNLAGMRLLPKANNVRATSIQSVDDLHLTYSRIVFCPTCKGIGKIMPQNDPAKIKTCPICNGFGIYVQLIQDIEAIREIELFDAQHDDSKTKGDRQKPKPNPTPTSPDDSA